MWISLEYGETPAAVVINTNDTLPIMALYCCEEEWSGLVR